MFMFTMQVERTQSVSLSLTLTHTHTHAHLHNDFTVHYTVYTDCHPFTLSVPAYLWRVAEG